MKFHKLWKMCFKDTRFIKTNNLIKKVLLKMIRFYQDGISPLLGPRCRFTPTCSQYTYEAIIEHGVIKGTYLGIKRILKCNPFFKGGYDPVPCKKDKKESLKTEL